MIPLPAPCLRYMGRRSDGCSALSTSPVSGGGEE